MSQKILISIHASRMGGDSLDRTTVPVFHVFQSTPPGWEATDWPLTPPKVITNFNPRLPDGRRPAAELEMEADDYFNPRLPDGRRRAGGCVDICHIVISIHASRMGGDLACYDATHYFTVFQSTPPGWEATISATRRRLANKYFNPRLPDGRRPPMPLVICG